LCKRAVASVIVVIREDGSRNGNVTLVTETVCSPIAFGAVYRPLALIVPTEVLPPAVPSTDQVTPVVATPWMFALNCCDPPGANRVPAGEIERLRTVTAAAAAPDPAVVTFAAIV
jgi:hypothetical protein